MSSFKPPGQCPACGEWVPRGQAACDCCGACDSSGWNAQADVYDGLDLPDDPDDFNYDEFVEKEFGGQAGGRRSPQKKRELFWRWVAAIVLIVMVLGYVVAVIRG